MAGSGLIGIKRRIKSVSSTKKITKAMGLVATAKLRKTREKLESNNKYYESLSEILQKLLDGHKGYNIYKNGNDSRKSLYIVLTSDQGLCGAFNGSVLSTVIEQIRKNKDNFYLSVVGSKGVSYFKRFGYDIKSQFIDLPDVPTIREVKNVYNDANSLYEQGIVGEVYVFYTEYMSNSKQEVRFEKLLPLGSDEDENFLYKEYLKFEPDVNTLLNNTVPLYLKEKLLHFMLHSKTSEQSTRMAAMDGATKNANELLDGLKLQFNRMRQGAITQEISEIVGGAEAQK